MVLCGAALGWATLTYQWSSEPKMWHDGHIYLLITCARDEAQGVVTEAESVCGQCLCCLSFAHLLQEIFHTLS